MRWKDFRPGIYSKFIVAMGALALIPAAFMGIKLLGISERGIEASVLELHTKLAEKLAEGLQGYLQTVDDRVRFTINAAQKSSLDWQGKQELLGSLIESNPDVMQISVLDNKGMERLKIYNPAFKGDAKPVSRADEPGFREFEKKRDRYLKLIQQPDQAPLLEIYYSLNEKLALRVLLQLKTLWESIGSERVGGTGFAMVVGNGGEPLLYPPERMPSGMRSGLARWPIVTQALSAVAIGSSEYRDPMGVMQLGAYAPLPGYGGAVIIQQSKAEAYLAATQMKRTAALVFVIVGFVAILVAVFMARHLTLPILAITHSAAEVARGAFPGRVLVNTGDELQDMADTFNEMVAQLRKYAELQVDRLLSEQQKTEAILFSIDDGILMTDDKGKIRLANRRAREILEVKPEETLEGRHLEDVVADSPLRKLVLAMAANPNENLPKEVDLSTDQYARYIRVLSRPVVIPGKGTKVGVVTGLRDVTAEKQLDKMKEEFLHSITHDLRNPVGSIMGFTEFLVKGVVGPTNDQQKSMLTSIQKASSRLLSMINNILDAAKMETGKIEVKLKPISLAGVAGHAIDVLGALAQRRGIKMELLADEEFSVLVDGDLIERVFANLIGNALKFAADDGSVKVSIVDEGEYLKACVADDGEGIPALYLNKIFEKFEQVPGQKRGGTGLGLTICKYVVEAHLGRIWVESEVGKGARFYFTIPKDLGYNSKGEVVRVMGAPAKTPAQ